MLNKKFWLAMIGVFLGMTIGMQSQVLERLTGVDRWVFVPVGAGIWGASFVAAIFAELDNEP